jgi:hypothetical protein
MTGLSVTVNPNNALSTRVSFTAVNADSGRVFYWVAGGSRDSTPFAPLNSGTSVIFTLGLRPGTTYFHVTELAGGGGRYRSDSVSATTGALPPALLQLTLNAAHPWSGGGYLLAGISTPGAAGFAVAFDSAGALRWYREFEGGLGFGDFKQQPNGNFTAFLGETPGWLPSYGRFVELTPGGDIIGEYSAGTPFYTDNHELLETEGPDGGPRLHFFGYELRIVDLSAFGGSPTALVAGHVLLRQTASGSSEFMWNAWDHLTLDEWIEEPSSLKQNANIDFDHPNSLDFDLDGNYIISFRSLAQVMKLDARTGDIIWRLGGLKNQFTIANDPLNGFSGQHCVRVLPDGHLLMFDNGWRHTPPESRAVEYAIDPVAKTATMVWEFRHSPTIFTGFTGSVQRLRNGNTLVGYAAAGHVTEARPDGTVAWEGDILVGGQPYAGYRMIRIASLYQYRQP